EIIRILSTPYQSHGLFRLLLGFLKGGLGHLLGHVSMLGLSKEPFNSIQLLSPGL
ncbi:hypothetical protein L9F63_005375, partial [Diploptera punctata]